MDKLIKLLKDCGLFTAGIIGHHYGSQLLSHKSEIEAQKNEELRDTKLNIISEEIKNIGKNLQELTDRGKTMEEKKILTKDSINEVSNIVDSTKKSGSKIIEHLNNPDLNEYRKEIGNKISQMTDNLDQIKKIIEEILKGGNNLFPNLNDLYKFLDSLTLLQESALLHVILFFVLILTTINILAILFGNEILNYFDLENKYPSLAKFFKLRSLYKKYSLFWNIFLLIFICISGIALNILTLYAA